MKVLIVRKMSALEYYYNGNNKSVDLERSHREQEKSLKNIKEILRRKDSKYEIVIRRELTDSLITGCDLVISAGGDGTVIATAAYNLDTPQLNLKLDRSSKGNLCCKNVKEALEKVFGGKHKRERWARQDVYLDGKLIGRALNETCVGENMDFCKMARYELNGEYHRNSGLIIVTGTGSTGWPTAFPKYSRRSKIFKFKTILPVEGREEGRSDYFRIKYKGHEGKFTIDTINYDFPRDSILEIKLSKDPLRVIIPN